MAQTYPIVLAHGIARFDFLRASIVLETKKMFGDLFHHALTHLSKHGIELQTDQLHYFRGIRSYLKDAGFEARQTNVGFASGLENRAHDLKSQIEGVLQSTNSAKVHIISHSMGGLDSRFMIAKLDMADRVASLTTIGTPHRGSSFADAGEEVGGTALIDRISNVIDVRGFKDLTGDACKSFNESTAEAEATNRVFYQTYSSAQERDLVFSPLKWSWDVIASREGPNDGLVSVTSQSWVSELVASDGSRKVVPGFSFPVSADHLNEVGWWDLDEMHGNGPFSKLESKDNYERTIKQVYVDIARDLSARFPL